jgi:hypothetical protein
MPNVSALSVGSEWNENHEASYLLSHHRGDHHLHRPTYDMNSQLPKFLAAGPNTTGPLRSLSYFRHSDCTRRQWTPADFLLSCRCNATLCDALKSAIPSQTAASSRRHFVRLNIRVLVSPVSGIMFPLHQTSHGIWLFGTPRHLNVNQLSLTTRWRNLAVSRFPQSGILQHAPFHYHRCRSFVPAFIHPLWYWVPGKANALLCAPAPISIEMIFPTTSCSYFRSVQLWSREPITLLACTRLRLSTQSDMNHWCSD